LPLDPHISVLVCNGVDEYVWAWLRRTSGGTSRVARRGIDSGGARAGANNPNIVVVVFVESNIFVW
jgi:hypothetical protein